MLLSQLQRSLLGYVLAKQAHAQATDRSRVTIVVRQLAVIHLPLSL